MRSLPSPTFIARTAATAAVVAGLAASAPAAFAATPTMTLYTVPAPYSANSPDIEGAMMPAPDGGGEWFVLADAGTTDPVMEVTTGGSFSEINGSLPDGDSWVASVTANGAGWLQAEGGDLWQVTAGGTATDYGTPGGDAEDMALGSDGALYITDNGDGDIIRCSISSGPPATCSTDLLSNLFSANDPDAIAAVGNELFFSTDNAELGSLTLSGLLSGPFGDDGRGNGTVSSTAGSMVAGANGLLYAAGGQGSDGNATDIVAINPATGAVEQTYGNAQGMPSGANPTTLTAADGNIWFMDDGTNAVGELDVATGTISEYAVPDNGDALGMNNAIAAGPSGTNTVFFSAQDANGNPIMGEITGAQNAAPEGTTVTSGGPGLGSGSGSGSGSSSASSTFTSGSEVSVGITRLKGLSVARSAKVSADRQARLALDCGPGATVTGGCTGHVALWLVRTKHGKRVLGSRLAQSAYTMATSTRTNVKVTLNKSAFKQLEHAAHHQLVVGVTVANRGGDSAGGTVTLVGPRG